MWQTISRASGSEADRLTDARVRTPTSAGYGPRHTGNAAAVLGLQAQAGNAAVAGLLGIQRDDAPPAASSPQPTPQPATLQITVRQVPTPAASPGPAAPAGGAAPPVNAPAGSGPQGATPAAPGASTAAGDKAAAPQFQVQYAFQGQRTAAIGPGRDTTAPAVQGSTAKQIAVQINVSHHDDDHPGREESYAVQGTFDASTGVLSGVTGQFQEALVTATRQHLQGQVFGNVAAGVTVDPPGPGGTGGGAVRPTAGVGVGTQGTLVISDRFQLWVAGQVGVGLTTGPGAPGSGGGAVLAPSLQGSAGFTITIP